MDKRTIPEKKAAFLEALTAKYTICHAARAAGVGRSTVYEWRQEDSAFAQAWDDALEDAVDALETTMYERAMKSDTVAAIFLLKGMRPEKYKDRVAQEHSGELEIKARLADMSDDELERFARGEK